MEKGDAIEDLGDVWDGSPGEAGHTGAGIKKPGGRYDPVFNAHSAQRGVVIFLFLFLSIKYLK